MPALTSQQLREVVEALRSDTRAVNNLTLLLRHREQLDLDDLSVADVALVPGLQARLALARELISTVGGRQ